MNAETDDEPEPKSGEYRRHAFSDGELTCPHDFRVTTIFSANTRDKEFAPNVVVTRDRLRHEETGETYVSRQLVDLARKLKKFKLHGRKQVTIAGVPATQLSCGWLGSDGFVEQTVTMVVRKDHVVSFTTSAAKARSDEYRLIFEEILGSVTFNAEPP